LNGDFEHLRNVLNVLCKEQIYVNLKKCTFCMEKIIFLVYIVSAQGIKMDKKKVKTSKNGLHLNHLLR
jgi:hypothetical protein